jgi:tetratricopeptide (TPR) repeat protein
LYELYSQKRPDDANAQYAIGRILLAKGDEKGVEIITKACEKEPRLKLNAYEWLTYFYRQKNEENSAKYWQHQAEKQVDIENAAYQERANVHKNDHYQLPDRSINIEKVFTDHILGIKGVKSAWLAEKRMNFFPDHKTFVIAIEKAFFDNAEKIMETIVASLEIEHNFFIVIKGGSHSDIAKQVIKKGRQLF